MSFLLAGLAALTLSAETQAEPAAAVAPPAPADTTPRVLNMTSGCWPQVVPQGGLCEVVGTATLGQAGGTPVSWSLYEITGDGQYGLSVLFAPGADGQPKIVSTMRVPSDKVESWRADPYVVASVIERDGADYVATAMRGADGPSELEVHRIDADGWRKMETAELWPLVEAKLTSVTGAQCYPIGGDINWRTFGLRYDMMSDTGTCGTAFLDLGFEDDAVTVTSALAVRPDLTPLPHRRRGRR